MSCPVSDQCRLVSNHQAIRIDFFAPGSGVYAVRFHSKEGFAAFTDAYRDALFENTHRMRASDENKEKVYGVGMSAWAQGTDHPDAVWDPTDERPPGDAADADAMEEDDYEDESKGHHTASGEDVLDMKMGALDNSFLVRGNAVDVFRNQAGGALRDANVRVSLKDSDGAFITPTKGILADAEQSMLLLAGDGPPG